MKNTRFFPLTVLLGAMALNVTSLNVQADDAHYVYTNNGQESNTVTGFKVGRNGSLIKIGKWDTKGATSGTSSDDCDSFYASSRTSASKSGDLLFVSNSECGSSVGNATISIFRGASYGRLSLVKPLLSDPDLTPGATNVASFGNCLILSSANGNIISYKLPWVKRVNKLSLGSTIDDMKINKIGQKRYVAATLVNDHQIAVTQINPNSCTLGMPARITTAGNYPAGLGFSPDGKKMYVGDANEDQTIVEVFNFPSSGTPITPLTNSPYTFEFLPGKLSGKNSNTVLVSKDGKCLFVANQYSSTVSAISLLNGVPSPSATAYEVGTGNGMPIGMANDLDRKQFYVGIAGDNTVTTKLVSPGCKLTNAPGGTKIPTDVEVGSGFLTSIVATGDN